MCRQAAADETMQRLQDQLEQMGLHGGAAAAAEFRALAASKGAGPRLFCGHVPKEATEELVKAHFSQWGVVTDVYFPRHKKTLKRRPFCFVTFASHEAAERALAESPLTIFGIPIKNLTMVEDRDKYYQEKHASARQALLQALQNMTPGQAAGLNLGLAPAGAPAGDGADHIAELSTLLAMEGMGNEAALLLQQARALAGGAPGPGSAASGSRPSLDSRAGAGGMHSHSSHSSLLPLSNMSGLSGGYQHGSNSTLGDQGSFADMSRADSRGSIPSADWFSAASSRQASMDVPSYDLLLQQAQQHHAAVAALARSQAYAGQSFDLGALNAVPQHQTGRLSLDAAMRLHAQQQAQQQHYQMPQQRQSNPYGHRASMGQRPAQQAPLPTGLGISVAMSSSFYAPAPQQAPLGHGMAPAQQQQQQQQHWHDSAASAAALSSAVAYQLGLGNTMAYFQGAQPQEQSPPRPASIDVGGLPPRSSPSRDSSTHRHFDPSYPRAIGDLRGLPPLPRPSFSGHPSPQQHLLHIPEVGLSPQRPSVDALLPPMSPDMAELTAIWGPDELSGSPDQFGRRSASI